MVLVLIGQTVVLQEDLDLLVHLRPNVLQEEASNDRNTSETNGSQRNGPESYVSKCKLTARLG